MNVILVIVDTLRRDHVGAYGNEWIRTPNLDRLAERGTRFTSAYLGSAPCMPARRELWTGRYEFPWRGWGPLEPGEATLPGMAGQAGCRTALVTDHYHYFEHGSGNYHHPFDTWQLIRGNENDAWVSDATVPVEFPAPERTKCHFRWRQYVQNKSRWGTDAEAMCQRVFSSAADWVETNHRSGPFFLVVDNFDPHEPFDSPEPYASMYNPDPPAERVVWPIYGPADRYTDQELCDIRALYAGKVTLTDRWLGHFIERVEACGVMDDTLLIVCADHGHQFGEHGMIGKPSAWHGDSNLYEFMSRIPLLVCHPGGRGPGQTRDACVQHVDVVPTVLDALGADVPDGLHGQSLMPLLDDARATIRDAAVFGKFGEAVNASDGRWVLYQWPSDEANTPLYWHSLWPPQFLKPRRVDPFDPGRMAYPVHYVRGDQASALYDVVADPAQATNVIDQHPDEAARLRLAIRTFWEQHDCPREQLERVGLV